MNTQEARSENQDDRNTQIEQLVVDVFGDEPKDPILGVTDSIVIAPNLRTLLQRPSTIIVTSQDEKGKIVGFSLAIPIGDMNPSKTKDSETTAYIYYTALEPAIQGQGIVKSINREMLERLAAEGYTYVERDSDIANGYADKITKSYASAIVESYDHEGFPETGPERFFKIDIQQALALN